MILGIGIDVVKIDRINELVTKFGDKFYKKIFTDFEIASAQKINNSEKQMAFFAKRFAAKEAFAKACGLGLGRGIDFIDIEVVNDELGKPFIRILNNKIDFLINHFKAKEFAIHLSLSDEKDLATAKVIIDKIDTKQIA